MSRGRFYLQAMFRRSDGQPQYDLFAQGRALLESVNHRRGTSSAWLHPLRKLIKVIGKDPRAIVPVPAFRIRTVIFAFVALHTRGFWMSRTYRSYVDCPHPG